MRTISLAFSVGMPCCKDDLLAHALAGCRFHLAIGQFLSETPRFTSFWPRISFTASSLYSLAEAS